MENIFVEFLPPWVETGLQPAFYDKESGTVLQQTARMYARVNMLIRMFNKLSKNTKTEVERFETAVNEDMAQYKHDINETVADYIERFNQLHDYVYDYFDNLDVQEEINNKLDDMVEQGTLQNIIYDYINAKAIFGYDNVASMKSTTNLVDGSYAETLGYYSKNDGGGGLYKIRTKLGTDSPDEMLMIAIGDNLVAELVVDTTINSKQCGLKGDGSTDETNKLNTFFAISTDYDKILNKGIYLTSDTVFIKGRWADTYPNPYRITFDQASIKYNGSADGCSIVVFNHKRSEIDGLNLATNSNSNYIQVIGCWYNEFSSWHCKYLKIDTDPTLISALSYDSPAVMYTTFRNLRLQYGKLYLNRPSSYINSVFFDNCVFGGSTNDFCIEVSGPAGAFENIVFHNSDLSDASTAVMKIANELNRSASFKFDNCYLDTKIPLLYNDNNNKATITTYGIFSPHVYNLLPKEYGKVITQTHIGDTISCGNFIGTENVNYVKNGDISSSNEISGGYSELFGVSSAYWNKEYTTNPLNANNRARKMTLLQALPADTTTIGLATINAPRDGKYTAYIRFKVIQGTFTKFDLHFMGIEHSLTRSEIENGKEILLVADSGRFVAADAALPLYISLSGTNGSDDIILEVYEVGVIMGSTYIPYAKLHEAAKL